MNTQHTNTVKWDNELKLHRTNRGYSQSDIAEMVGLSQNTIYQIERGALSGRKHMDSIGYAIKMPPNLIFPYYEYLTYSEAAEKVGVSSTLIAKRVEDGSIEASVVGGVKMVKREDLQISTIKKRPLRSIRVVMSEFLETRNGTGGTVEEMLYLFGPYPSSIEREKKRKSMQSILSRSTEFIVDKNQKPPLWHVSNV